MGIIYDFETGKASEIIDPPCECEDGNGYDPITSSNPFPWFPQVVADKIRVQLEHDRFLDYPITKDNAHEAMTLGATLVLMATRLLRDASQ